MWSPKGVSLVLFFFFLHLLSVRDAKTGQETEELFTRPDDALCVKRCLMVLAFL